MLLNVQWQYFLHIQDEDILMNDDDWIDHALCQSALTHKSYVLCGKSAYTKFEVFGLTCPVDRNHDLPHLHRARLPSNHRGVIKIGETTMIYGK